MAPKAINRATVTPQQVFDELIRTRGILADALDIIEQTQRRHHKEIKKLKKRLRNESE